MKLSYLCGFGLGSLVRVTLSALTVVALASLIVATVVCVDIKGTGTGPASGPAVRRARCPRGRASPSFAGRGRGSARVSVRDAALSRLLGVSAAEKTACDRSTGSARGEGVGGRSALPTAEGPPVGSPKDGPPRDRRSRAGLRASPRIPYDVYGNGPAYPSLYRVKPRETPDETPAVAPGGAPGPGAAGGPAGAAVRREADPGAGPRPGAGAAAPRRNVLSSLRRRAGRSAALVRRRASAWFRFYSCVIVWGVYVVRWLGLKRVEVTTVTVEIVVDVVFVSACVARVALYRGVARRFCRSAYDTIDENCLDTLEAK